MSVMFSDNLNDAWQVCTENILRNSISIDKSKQYLALLKGAVSREISFINVAHRMELSELKINLNKCKLNRIDMVQYANDLLGGMK